MYTINKIKLHHTKESLQMLWGDFILHSYKNPWSTGRTFWSSDESGRGVTNI